MKRLAITIFVTAAILLTSCKALSTTQLSKEDASSSAAFIENKGSDTLVNLALAWAEHYQELHPEIQISVTGGGSGTGITALINGTVDIANASRQIKSEEIETAISKGIEPYEFIVANDAIAMIINPENPIDELTLEQVSKIYRGEIRNWNELGGEDRPIVRLSRETNSGTHIYFLETVVRLGNKQDKSLFSTDTLLLPSSEGIIAEVRENPNAIGYDGLGYVTPEVKIIALAIAAQGPFVLPSAETVRDGTYPISRHLYMYTNGEPQGFIRDYLEWIISSNESQQFVLELGFVPYIAD
ncbi:MAG TPA: PstS family phosphate ABC transporter substrate-binding protein [Anaerolineae bacterium]|nr:PstS family phosphate ABC transporter substrate-binding protein [Anaerolineae bacterium]